MEADPAGFDLVFSEVVSPGMGDVALGHRFAGSIQT